MLFFFGHSHLIANIGRIASHFGSKAKLPGADCSNTCGSRSIVGEEEDVLKIDLDTYLSEADDLPDPKRAKPTLKSIVIKPITNQVSVKANSLRGKFHSPRVAKNRRSHQREHSPSIVHRSRNIQSPTETTTTSPNLVVSITNDTFNASSVPVKQFETRGTQTERTGACKCSRAVQQRNQRRRLEHQQNKELLRQINSIEK